MPKQPTGRKPENMGAPPAGAVSNAGEAMQILFGENLRLATQSRPDATRAGRQGQYPSGPRLSDRRRQVEPDADDHGGSRRGGRQGFAHLAEAADIAQGESRFRRLDTGLRVIYFGEYAPAIPAVWVMVYGRSCSTETNSFFVMSRCVGPQGR